MHKKLLANTRVLVILAVGVLLVGVLASVLDSNFQWLGRFGSLVICVGVIIMARPTIVGEEIREHVYMAETDLSDLDPEHWKTIGEPVPEYVWESVKSRAAVGWIGPTIVFLGTAINGFADLLNRVVGW